MSDASDPSIPADPLTGADYPPDTSEVPTNEELVERVRRRVALEHPLEWRVDAEAALATLSERLEAATDLAETGRESIKMLALREKDYAAAEAERDRLRDILKGFLHDAEQGDLPGKGLREMARAALADQEGEAT